MTERELELNVQRQRCPYCKDDVAPHQEKVACDGCMAWHHTECWTSHGSCSMCSSTQVSGAGERAAPVVRRPCKIARCTEPATEVLAIGELCRPHARGILERQAKETWSWFFAGFMALFGVASVVAVQGFAPADPSAYLIVVPFIFGVALALTVGPLRRRKGRQLLEELDGKEKKPYYFN